MSVAAVPARAPWLSGATGRRLIQRNAWAAGIYFIFAALLVTEKIIHPSLSSFDVQNLVVTTIPLALAAMGQASVVLVGGIDLSVGAMMALVNVVAATWMLHADFRQAILLSLVIIAGNAVIGGAVGFIITISRVPDIIVTLATSFIWSGLALQIMEIPGGGVPTGFSDLVNGELWGWLPEALVVLIAAIIIIWVPFRRSKLGLAIYALGSSRNAAYLSGVSVGWTRIAAYALGGVFVSLAGLALTGVTFSGDPNSASNYTLTSVAAVVLGGVSLAGGRGGLLGPVAAAFVLSLIGTILSFLNVDANWSTVIQGAVVVIVVLFAGILALRRRT